MKISKLNIVVFLIASLYILLSINSAKRGGDFDVYLDAAIKLSKGENIYVAPFINGLQYFYSPLFALLLEPFTTNFFIIEFLWLIISGVFLIRIFKLCSNYLNFNILSQKENYLFVVITSFFIIRFLLYNIGMIQITVFLLWCILESISYINKGKSIHGAFLLALAINIKLMPLVFLPYLLYRAKFKAFLWVVIFSIVFLFLPSIFIGFDFNNFLLSEWLKVINPVNKEHLIEPFSDSQSLVGLVPVFISDTIGDININRNFFHLSIEKAVLITNLARLGLILFTLFFLNKPFKALDKLTEFRAIAYICLIVPMIFPHQQKYAFLFLYPMMIYLTYVSFLMFKYNRTLKFKITLISLLFVSLIYSPFIGSDILGRYFYTLLHHFRFLGIATLLLIIYSIILSPNKVNTLVAVNKEPSK